MDPVYKRFKINKTRLKTRSAHPMTDSENCRGYVFNAIEKVYSLVNDSPDHRYQLPNGIYYQVSIFMV